MSALTLKEFAEVINFIKNERSPLTGKLGFVKVKYVDPVFDMRTDTVFYIKFRTFGSGDKEFSSACEPYELSESMFNRIMAWLNTEIY